MRLGQDLKTVTDAKNRTSVLRELLQRSHDVSEAGDGAGSQIVTVGEAAGNDHRVDTLEVSISVPQLDRLGTHPLHTIQGVPVAVGSRKDRNSDSHSALPAHRFAPPHSLITRPPTRTLLSSGWRGACGTSHRPRPRSRPPSPRASRRGRSERPGSLEQEARSSPPRPADRGCRPSGGRGPGSSIYRASLGDLRDPAEHLGVGLLDASQIVPETVLV